MIEGISLFMFISVIISIILLNFSITNKELYYGCPKYLYVHSNLNILGVILCSILLFVLIPLYYFLYFIYWICHIGRSNKN